jgi:N-methylhydantoinase B
MKTSHLTIFNFNEGLDFTCGFADMNGNMIAATEFCPAQIGGMPLWAQEIPFDTIGEGDVILRNDPYRGGLHIPDHTFVSAGARRPRPIPLAAASRR